MDELIKECTKIVQDANLNEHVSIQEDIVIPIVENMMEKFILAKPIEGEQVRMEFVGIVSTYAEAMEAFSNDNGIKIVPLPSTWS